MQLTVLCTMKLVDRRRLDLVKLIVPRIVLRELDGLNHRTDMMMKSQITTIFRMLEAEQLRASSQTPVVLHLQV